MPIVETKLCKQCSASFDITDDDLQFYDKISPTFDGQPRNTAGQIPAPSLCPGCRQQRRLAFRNERSLYRRTCDASQKQIISMYSPDKPYKVYDQKIRWSDQWDPMDYGREFDFSKTFTENFDGLMRVVPMLSLAVYFSENCEYNNYIMRNKNCYMIFSGPENTDCIFGRNIRRCNSCVDNLQLVESERCSNITIGANNYNCHYGFHIFQCRNSKFLYYCEGCSDCLLCSHLVNKQYCFKNKQYSPKEYAVISSQFNYGSFESQQKILQEFKAVQENFPHHGKNLINNEGECGYDFIRNSKNVQYSYNISDGENMKYCEELEECKDMLDCNIGVGMSSLCYESIAIGKSSHKLLFSFTVTDCNEVYYSFNCVNQCSYLFGCIGLRNKSYCIFNQQYTKDEYEKTVAKIISHMQETGERGEFFDPSLSPFGYNETVAQEYYPLDQEDAEKKGFQRSTYQPPLPKSDKIINAQDLPQTIQEVDDTILQYAIACEVTGRLFRIQPQELAFYRKHTIPLPHRHPDQRHLDRLALRK